MAGQEFHPLAPVLSGHVRGVSAAKCWYALRTRCQHEKVVRLQLTRLNIENFLPTVKRWSQWKDRTKELEFPLFSGYCFARFSLGERLPVLQASGVVEIVGSNGPEPIPESEINSLRILTESHTHYRLEPCPKEGESVEVIQGPLKGVKGRLLLNAKSSRLFVNMTFIPQALAVEIDASMVMVDGVRSG
jgi:transcription antitermination factor NusG